MYYTTEKRDSLVLEVHFCIISFMPVKEGTPNNVERSVLKGRMRSGLQQPLVAIVSENPERSFQAQYLPRLFPTDDRVKWDNEGNVWIVSYRSKDKVKDVDYERWGIYKDVEAAIRGTGYVAEAYGKDGERSTNVKNVITQVRDLSRSFQRPGITLLEINQMAQVAATTLVENNYDTAVKPEKQEVVKKIMEAVRVDKLDRVNPSRSRLILSHAWVDLIQELLIDQRIEDKYSALRSALIRSREFQRFLLEQAAAYLEDAVTLRRGDYEEARTIRELKIFARRYLSNHFINTKPYSRVAAKSRFLIVHTGTQKEIGSLSGYIGNDAEIYKGTPQLSQLDGRDRKKRLSQISTAIKEVLKEGEDALVPKDNQ